MFKKLLTLSAAFLLFTLAMATDASASGKMEVALGQEVVIEADPLVGEGEYTWVVTKDGEILDTQTNPTFRYFFDFQGEHIVNLSQADEFGNGQKTTVFVMVGDRYSKMSDSGGVFDTPLQANFSTLPTMNEDRVVNVVGEEGRVVFDVDFRADGLEYRIDRNIFIDSDGNGVANDDIDNAADPSYFLAGMWETTYLSTESNQVTAEVTVVSASGQQASSQVDIVFGSTVVTDSALEAILDSLPLIDSSDSKIYLYGVDDRVAFYARRSQGDILEYRIDKNIFVDTDGDGDPSNDIDNRNDSSFTTGDVWMTDYADTGEQIIAQLDVVSPTGTGSRIQREVVFTDRPIPDASDVNSGGSAIRLAADKEFVQIGDPIRFSVEGLSEALEFYSFEWDFDGDGQADQTVDGVNEVVYIYDAPGINQVSVRVVDLNANEATFIKEITVKDVVTTRAIFDFTVEGSTVTFNNTSTASVNLSNQNLSYTWNFADLDEENFATQQDKIGSENPVYTYSQPGTYSVGLTVVDSNQVTDTVRAEVLIEGAAGQEVNGGEVVDPAEPEEASGSLIARIFKVILYVVLVILILLLLFMGGMLIFLKVQHPDLVFEELIDELKIKLLSMIGVHEDDILASEAESDSPSTAAGVTGGKIPPYKPTQTRPPVKKPESKVPVPKATVPVVKPEPVKAVAPKPVVKPAESSVPSKAASRPPEDLSKSNAPMPDWLKPKNNASAPASPVKKPAAIQGEVVQKPPDLNTVKPPTAGASMPTSPSANPAKPDFSSKPSATPATPDLSKKDGPVPDWLKDA